MTEGDWLGCEDMRPMLDVLRVRASARKHRLFGAACCRSSWHLLEEGPHRDLVELAETHADRRATRAQLRAARKAVEAGGPGGSPHDRLATRTARHAACEVARDDGGAAGYGAAFRSAEAIAYSDPTGIGISAMRASYRALVPLVREVFGNPFRPSPIDRAWLTPAVSHLAAAAYEERSLPSGHLDPARLSVLADALEDAGCSAQEVLGHLRSEGPHVRGCWALDLVLGKG